MEWIDVELRKPKSGKSVLVYCVPKYRDDEDILGFEVNVGYREDEDWYLNSKNLDEILYISHWMELPEIPKNIIL